jgi:glucosamine-6-phosphate deaminase
LGINLHIHPDTASLTEAAGKQAAAALRLAVVSAGYATLILSGDPEVEPVVDFLASREGIDWKKVLIFPMCEFVGISRISKGSLQNDFYKRIVANNSGIDTKGLINGEAIPSSEINRISASISNISPVLVLTGIGNRGEIGLAEELPKNQEETGYRLVEPSEAFRKELANPGRFRTIHEVPRKGITLSMKSLLASKHIITCVTGKSKSELAAKITAAAEPEIPCQLLASHPNFHLHLDRDAASGLSGAEIKS